MKNGLSEQHKTITDGSSALGKLRFWHCPQPFAAGAAVREEPGLRAGIPQSAARHGRVWYVRHGAGAAAKPRTLSTAPGARRSLGAEGATGAALRLGAGRSSRLDNLSSRRVRETAFPRRAATAGAESYALSHWRTRAPSITNATQPEGSHAAGALPPAQAHGG